MPGAKGAVAALCVSLAGAALTAHAGMTRPTHAMTARGVAASPPTPAPVSGAHPMEEGAAPAPGVTGTARLPALPVTAAQAAAAEAALPRDGSVLPARPFVLAGSSADRMRALQCLTTAIYYEAASEPDAGQAAVAQVILNRVRHPAFPATVCGVIYQGSERRGCQFSYACDGAMARVPMRSAWERARRAAARALAGYVYAPVGLATHYHTYAVTPAWNRALVMTDAVGAHFFHRWKGWWGTPAAFSRRYAGGEPLPGPHLPADLPPPSTSVAQTTADLLKAAAAPYPPAVTPVMPDHAEAGTPLARFAVGDADSQILDRWKDTGKPLR